MRVLVDRGGGAAGNPGAAVGGGSSPGKSWGVEAEVTGCLGQRWGSPWEGLRCGGVPWARWRVEVGVPVGGRTLGGSLERGGGWRWGSPWDCACGGFPGAQWRVEVGVPVDGGTLEGSWGAVEARGGGCPRVECARGRGGSPGARCRAEVGVRNTDGVGC